MGASGAIVTGTGVQCARGISTSDGRLVACYTPEAERILSVRPGLRRAVDYLVGLMLSEGVEAVLVGFHEDWYEPDWRCRRIEDGVGRDCVVYADRTIEVIPYGGPPCSMSAGEVVDWWGEMYERMAERYPNVERYYRIYVIVHPCDEARPW